VAVAQSVLFARGLRATEFVFLLLVSHERANAEMKAGQTEMEARAEARQDKADVKVEARLERRS
jgi:hypothetical protein